MGIEHIDPLALVEDISLAERQIVEIVRAISHEPRRPVARRADLLAGRARGGAGCSGRSHRLRAAGTCIIFTSHRWNEIRNIADRITVFRGGRDVGTFTEIAEDEAITLMTGRRVEALYPALPAVRTAARRALRGQGLVGPAACDGVSLHAAPGEILGVGGLAGHGHRELFFTLFGAERLAGGRGRWCTAARCACAARATPSAAASASRWCRRTARPRACCSAMSVRDNMTLAVLRPHLRAPACCGSAHERQLAQSIVDRLDVRMPGRRHPSARSAAATSRRC